MFKDLKLKINKGELTMVIAKAMRENPEEVDKVSKIVYHFLLSCDYSERLSKRHSLEYVIWELWETSMLTRREIADILGVRMMKVKSILRSPQPNN